MATPQAPSVSAEIVKVELPDQRQLTAACQLVLATEAATFHKRWLIERPQDYGAQVLMRLQNGLAIPAVSYLEAMRWRGPALAAYLQAVAANWVSAGVRLIPLGQSNGQTALGHRIHRGRQKRDVERDRFSQMRCGRNLTRHDVGFAGFEQNIVEGKSFANLHETLRFAWRV